MMAGCFSFFFFNNPSTTEIYTLSLHDALPIYRRQCARRSHRQQTVSRRPDLEKQFVGDRKSTRLNSSHANISYAVFCLKKKKINKHDFSKLLANVTMN